MMIDINKHIGDDYITWVCKSIIEDINANLIVANYAIFLGS